MARVVAIDEAQVQFADLLEQVLSGDEIVFAREGVPVARLVAVSPTKQRKLGQWQGRVQMDDDFDAPLSKEDLAAWEAS